MNTPNTHAKYTADMVHTEETIRLYAITQYNLFRKKQKYLTTLASCALIVSGMLIRTDIWPRALLLLIGCVLSTNLYAAPKHIADEVIRRFNGRLPVLCYSFGADRFTVNTSSVPVCYDSVFLLADDKKYLYIFLTPETGYMMNKASVSGEGGYEGLVKTLEEASGRTTRHTVRLSEVSLKTMIASIRSRFPNSGRL